MPRLGEGPWWIALGPARLGVWAAGEGRHPRDRPVCRKAQWEVQRARWFKEQKKSRSRMGQESSEKRRDLVTGASCGGREAVGTGQDIRI